MNNNIISDKQYDAKSKELVQYKINYPELWRKSIYYKQFGDEYNGSTGFMLYLDLDEHQKKIIQSLVPKNIY